MLLTLRTVAAMGDPSASRGYVNVQPCSQSYLSQAVHFTPYHDGCEWVGGKLAVGDSTLAKRLWRFADPIPGIIDVIAWTCERQLLKIIALSGSRCVKRSENLWRAKCRRRDPDFKLPLADRGWRNALVVAFSDT